MSGIGPFAVPLGMSNVTTHANDLNPSSHLYLVRNVKANKCEEHVKTYCMCAREFVHKLSDEGTAVTDVIMNLPATAVEFLDAFRSWNSEVCRLPMVHVYCFVKCQSMEATDAKDRIMPRVIAALGCTEEDLPASEVTIHIVRDVAPKKPMCCVSFRLPEAMATLERVDLGDYVEGVRKGSKPWGEGEGEEEEEEEEKEGGGGKRRKL